MQLYDTISNCVSINIDSDKGGIVTDKVEKHYKSQQEATARYNKKTYERLNIFVPRGSRQVIKDYAAGQGKSLNRFVCDLIEKEMNQKK